MAPFPLSLLLRRRYSLLPTLKILSSLPFSTAAALPNPSPASDPKSNLSARLSFVFDQIDAIDRRRSGDDQASKDAALQRIRAWRQSKHPPPPPNPEQDPPSKPDSAPDLASSVADSIKKDVELVHPWPEWIELMERLAHQNYFDHRRTDEDRVAENASIDLSRFKDEDSLSSAAGVDFSRDFITVRNACMNFGRDRFDILRSLSRKDLQILVGHGCPSMDPKVVFSSKLLRKHVHLDEGDVCSSCSLRNSCSRGYILTRKEDEARTLDVMRVLLTYGFDHSNGSVENKSLTKMKSVKTIVRKLLHEVVKLSAVPIDPNLPPPVIKKPPPKVKQPPPPPKKRVGRNDIEMKKGDWLCPKCDFMNFAKNIVCMQCDAKRPKKQLLPGEWECPQCNFLNYRRNMACFHCDAKRPPDEFTENQFQGKQSGPLMRSERATRIPDVSNAWNFNFDDNESDGADVAAFEFADSPKRGEDSSLDDLPHGGVKRGFEDDARDISRTPRANERGRNFSDREPKSNLHSHRTGFDDFDDEEEDDVDGYEFDVSNNDQSDEIPRRNFSELENTSGSEDLDDFVHRTSNNQLSEDRLSDSEDEELLNHPHWKSSCAADSTQGGRRGGTYSHKGKSFNSDDDFALNSDYDDDDVDEGFQFTQRKSQKQNLGSKGMRKGRDSDYGDKLLLDSDSDADDDNLYSSRHKMTGNKGQSGRRASTFGRAADFGSARRGNFRQDDRNQKDNFGDRDDRFFRGSRGDSYGSRRENYRFQHFDRPVDRNGKWQRANQFSDRSRDSQRNEKGSQGYGYDGRGDDRSRGSRGNEKGFHGRGYGGREGNGFRDFDRASNRDGSNHWQRGRNTHFTQQSRDFDDRPNRRIIER